MPAALHSTSVAFALGAWISIPQLTCRPLVCQRMT
jgi:hypothetical protein